MHRILFRTQAERKKNGGGGTDSQQAILQVGAMGSAEQESRSLESAPRFQNLKIVVKAADLIKPQRAVESVAPPALTINLNTPSPHGPSVVGKSVWRQGNSPAKRSLFEASREEKENQISNVVVKNAVICLSDDDFPAMSPYRETSSPKARRGSPAKREVKYKRKRQEKTASSVGESGVQNSDDEYSSAQEEIDRNMERLGKKKIRKLGSHRPKGSLTLSPAVIKRQGVIHGKKDERRKKRDAGEANLSSPEKNPAKSQTRQGGASGSADEYEFDWASFLPSDEEIQEAVNQEAMKVGHPHSSLVFMF